MLAIPDMSGEGAKFEKLVTWRMARPFLANFSFLIYCPLPSISMQNWGFVSSEIIGGRGFKNLKVGHVTLGRASFFTIFHFFDLVSLTLNPHAKFEVCIYSRSRDIRGSQNLKSGSRDLCHASFFTIFYFFWFSISLRSISVQNLRFVYSAAPEILGESQNLKSRSRDLGHAPFRPIFHFFGLLSLTINLHAKFEVRIFSRSRDTRASQNLKVGHLTQATLPCDQILFFELAPRSSRWSFKFQLNYAYCFGNIAVIILWHFGWKMPIPAIFCGFWDFDPWNCDIVVLTATAAEIRVLRHKLSKSVQRFDP